MWIELQNGFEWLPEPVHKKWFARIIRIFQRYWFNSSMTLPRRGFTRRGRVTGADRGRDFAAQLSGVNSPSLHFSSRIHLRTTHRATAWSFQRAQPDALDTIANNFRPTYFCWKSLRAVLRRAGLVYKDAIGYLPFRCLRSSRCVSSRYVI